MFADKKGMTIETIIATVIVVVVLIIVVAAIVILAKSDFSLGEYISNLFRFGGK